MYLLISCALCGCAGAMFGASVMRRHNPFQLAAQAAQS